MSLSVTVNIDGGSDRTTRAINRHIQRLRRSNSPNQDAETTIDLVPPRERARAQGRSRPASAPGSRNQNSRPRSPEEINLVPIRSRNTLHVPRSHTGSGVRHQSNSSQTVQTRRAEQEVVLLDDTLPDLDGSPGTSVTPDRPGDDLIDLTSDEEIVITIPAGARNTQSNNQPIELSDSPTGGIGRRGANSAPVLVNDIDTDEDLPLVAVQSPSRRTRNRDNDVIVIEKENRQTPGADSSLNDSDSLTPKRKMLSCPICMDHERTIRRTGRQIMSTTCGHIFCDDCIKKTIASMKSCPTCRKKLTPKNGIHPLFL